MYIFYQCTRVHVPGFLELVWQEQNSVLGRVTLQESRGFPVSEDGMRMSELRYDKGLDQSLAHHMPCYAGHVNHCSRHIIS